MKPTETIIRLNPDFFLPDGSRRPRQLKSQPQGSLATRQAPMVPKHTSKKHGKCQPSILEVKFMRYWRQVGGPALVEEYRFAPPRRWRADFCHMSSKTLIEVEGGAWSFGRHQRPIGFRNDCEKYLAAVLAGWTVVRLGSTQLKPEIIGAIAQLVRRRSNVHQCIE